MTVKVRPGLTVALCDSAEPCVHLLTPSIGMVGGTGTGTRALASSSSSPRRLGLDQCVTVVRGSVWNCCVTRSSDPGITVLALTRKDSHIPRPGTLPPAPDSYVVGSVYIQGDVGVE